jgi:hypothetical protein
MSKTWRLQKKRWISCIQEEQVEFSVESSFVLDDDTEITAPIPPMASVCAHNWSQPVNQVNCEFAWNGYEPGKELGEGAYYNRIREANLIEKLLGMAGYRMAAVLNTLFL